MKRKLPNAKKRRGERRSLFGGIAKFSLVQENLTIIYEEVGSFVSWGCHFSGKRITDTIEVTQPKVSLPAHRRKPGTPKSVHQL